MTTLAQRSKDISTTTPISAALAMPVHISPLPVPELSDLREPTWSRSVAEQLEEIGALTDGWDGSKAGPIRRDVIEFAAHVLSAIMQPITPAPHVTPMSHEGLMLEWHENGVDLEIEIERPGRLWVSFEDTVEGIEDEQPLTSNLLMLVTPVAKLTKRAVLSR